MIFKWRRDFSVPKQPTVFVAALLLSVVTASAQTNGAIDLSWFKIAGGGERSTGGGLELISTFGQPEAETRATAGNIAIDGGFLPLDNPAVIALPPSSQTNNAGANITLTVSAAGDNLTFQWRKDGTAIAGATGSSLMLNDIQRNTAGTYDVVVGNPFSTVTSPTIQFGVTYPLPFLQAAGIYNGLFYEGDGIEQQSAGFLTLKVGTNAAYTGKLAFDGDTLPFSGTFPASGHAVLNVLRAKIGKTDLVVNLSLDFGLWTDQITGSISTPAWTSAVLADRAVFNATNPAAAYAGNYTMLLPGLANAASGPPGFSEATLTLSSNGTVKATGFLADGTTLGQAVAISKHGQWPLYAPLYKITRVYTNLYSLAVATNRNSAAGSIIGWLTFTNNAPVGTVSWIKKPWTNAVYAGGFTNETAALGSRYQAPPLGTRALNATNGTITLTDGNLNAAITRNFFLGTNNALSITPTNNLVKLALTAKTGALKGTFAHPDKTNAITKINGVILQQQNFGGGFFVGTNQAGQMALQGN